MINVSFLFAVTASLIAGYGGQFISPRFIRTRTVIPVNNNPCRDMLNFLTPTLTMSWNGGVCIILSSSECSIGLSCQLYQYVHKIMLPLYN